MSHVKLCNKPTCRFVPLAFVIFFICYSDSPFVTSELIHVIIRISFGESFKLCNKPICRFLPLPFVIYSFSKLLVSNERHSLVSLPQAGLFYCASCNRPSQYQGRCMTFADCRLQTTDCRRQTADHRLQIVN